MSNQAGLQLPEEAVEAAARAFIEDDLGLTWEQVKPEYRDACCRTFRIGLDTALPSLIDHFRAAHECESCDDSGIYWEGGEWAPCDECNRGREFAECLRTAKAEALTETTETRTVYRVVGVNDAAEAWLLVPPTFSKAEAQREARRLTTPWNAEVRIQKRTVVVSPWEDLDEEAGGDE